MNSSWEVLPTNEEKKVCGLPVEKAEGIVRAFVQGSTKEEIARVFRVKKSVVSEIIGIARSVRNAPSSALPIFRKTHLLK